MSVAPARHARDSDSTFSPNIEAELSQVAIMPCAIARAQHVQRMIDSRCATAWSLTAMPSGSRSTCQATAAACERERPGPP